MKKAVIFSALVLLVALSFSACGGSGSSDGGGTPAPPTSKIAKRVFLLNQFNGKVQIIDAATDTLSGWLIPQSLLATFTSADHFVRAGSKTLVLDAGTNVLHAIDNSKEEIASSIQLDGLTESIVVNADGTRAYAAIPALGRIDVADLTTGKLTDPINGIAGVRRLALAKNGAKLLAFSNDLDTVVVVTTADGSKSTPIGGFSRPYTAVFSSDDSKAFVLSCGAECGGTSASVRVLDLSNNTPGASVAVGGATVGLLDGTNLFVAGSPAASTSTTNGGTFNVVNVSNTAALTASANVPISDGLHHSIVAVSSGKLYIGGRSCTIINNPPVSKGCLSIVNTSALTAVVGPARGEVTSIATIKGRNVAYVTQNGDLDIYDTASDTLQSKQIDITGKAIDAVEID